MARISLRPRQKVLYGLIVIILCLSVVEGTARFVRPESLWVNPNYVKISKDFPWLDELISDNQNWVPKFYDEFLHATAPVSTRHVNFTDYYSARWTPDSVPLSHAKNIVWTFGGSTMENQETTDSLTIANTWAKIFNHTLGPTHVKNFGTSGFVTSYELIKFTKLLREVPVNELPTIAIFYNGYNDAQFGFQFGPGKIQKDLSLKLEALVEHKNLSMLTYALSRMLSNYSAFWNRTGGRFVQNLLFPLPEPRPDAANLAAAVRVFTSNIRMIQAICESFRIRCFFVLQPLLMTKTPLTELEQSILDALESHPRVGREGTRFVREFYQSVRNKMAENSHFIDASHILNDRPQSDFYDFGHTSAETPPVIGERTALLILDQLTTKGQTAASHAGAEHHRKPGA